VAGGGLVLVAMVIGAIRFDPSVTAGAVAAVLAGIVAAGSNRSTAKEATHELAAAEAKRAVAFIRNRFPRTIAYLARDRMMPPGSEEQPYAGQGRPKQYLSVSHG